MYHFFSSAIIFMMIFLGICHGFENSQMLTVPNIEEGMPSPGVRVKVFLDKYPNAYYVLYLPSNFQENTKFPVIFEVPGNRCFLEDLCLGYGLSCGLNYIWVCVPHVDESGQIVRSYWGSTPSSSVNFWLEVLNDLNARVPIDQNKIILSGFSRGAVSTTYIGNYNNEISSKWAAYFAHSHFEGCCQVVQGDSEERIKKIKNRKILITVGENDLAKKCSKEAYTKLLHRGFRATYIEIPNVDHRCNWILEDSPASRNARDWLNNLFTE